MKKAKNVALVAPLLLIAACFFAVPLANGVRQGIRICVDTLIPSLFCLMILACFCADVRVMRLLAKPFGWLGRLFCMGSEFVVLPISLIGGYPIGAKLVAGCGLGARQSERLLCCAVNCGPAFLITVVGGVLLRDPMLGVWIYLSQILACFSTALLTRFVYRLPMSLEAKKQEKPLPFALRLVTAVRGALSSMALICGFVVLFCAIGSAAAPLERMVGERWYAILRGLLEVSSGCALLNGFNGNSRLLLLTAFTAFGGLCVHCQVFALTAQSGIRYSRFLLYRLFYTAVSVGAVWAGLLCGLIQMNGTVDCFSPDRTLQTASSAQSLGSMAMLFLMAVLFLRSASDCGKGDALPSLPKLTSHNSP